MSMTRERILARRQQFVAAALALSGCHEQPRTPPTTAKTTAASAPTPAPSTSQIPPPVDSDGDGVPDERDKCPYVAGVELREGCPAACLTVMPELRVVQQVYFAKDESTVHADSFFALDAVVYILREYPGMTLEVRGHVEAGEKSVGAARANAVCAYLVKEGVDKARLTTRDLGKSMPVAPPPNTKNRRVDFEITKQ